jgi:hypothetical protein
MKKYLILFLLLFSINSYSQVDSTKRAAARQEWFSNKDNWSNGQIMPNWDLDGNIIPIVGILLISSIFLKRKNKLRFGL